MSTTSRPAGDDRYDVLVVGGRVAGASTALLLARAGHRVAVVDRVRFPADTLSTHLVWPAGVVQLRRFGLLGRVVAAGTPPLTTIQNTVDGLSFEMPVWPESGVDAVYAPRRTVLDALILAAAEAAGADVYEGITVDGLSRDERGAVDGVVGHGPAGRPVRLAATIVVGADGWRSRVARDAGANTYDLRDPMNAVHYGYWDELDDRGVELWYRTTGLMAGVFPTNGGACVFVNCHMDRLRELRDQEDGWWRLLEEVAPDLVERLRGARQTAPVRGTAQPSFMRTAAGPGWVLVGDAGCTKDPASAHGITAALEDAERCAVAVAAALTDPAAATDAMRGYHEQRDAAARELYELAWAMASYEWDVAGLFELQARFAAELVREAGRAAASPPWPGATAAEAVA